MLHQFASYLGGGSGALLLFFTLALLMAFVGRIIISAGKREKLDALLMAFFFIELSAAFILLSFGFEEAETDSNPQLAPLLWGCSLFVCSALQFLRIWRKKDYKAVTYGNVGKVAAVVAVVAVTIALFNLLGFFISTGAMLIALMLLMGERRPVLMGTTVTVWMLSTWAIFNKLLLLGLPTGSLFR